MKINLLRGSLITGALAILCSVLFALPASAASYDDCAAGKLCLYSAENGASASAAAADQPLKDQPSTDPTHGTLSYTGWDDKTVSVFNNTEYWACLYADAQYGSTVQSVKPGWYGNLSRTSTTLQGKVSSHKLVPSKALCFTGFERCPDDKVCVFKERNGRGAMKAYAPADAANAYGTELGGPALSTRNRTNQRACFYKGESQTGTWTQPGETTQYRAFAVLSGDTTTLPTAFLSHKLSTKPDCS
ncbi:peptidase inhibitor family I36 protein [Streptomyces sp. NBC_01351]|uniref:peptidase inhibitor family I36 protein n=1 Tax=Streptomyces sp. NBC_01351 TaxID=2903833 RepID=UPI002E3394DD|nr:peptidase inhibitor family I36 protein [Streptomyces sp. NBC_01351]